MSAPEAVADAIAEGLHAYGIDALVEEDARTDTSVFRVEVEWTDGRTYHAVISDEGPTP